MTIWIEPEGLQCTPAHDGNFSANLLEFLEQIFIERFLFFTNHRTPDTDACCNAAAAIQK